MSYDLRFISRNGKQPPTIEAIEQWMQTQPHFTIEHKNKDWNLAYENTDTGVYFILNRSAANIHLNLNYCRPTFFAIETATVMSKLVAEFSLLVNDEKIAEYDADTLIKNWRKGNIFACEVMRSMGDELPWLEEIKATDLWRYLHSREQIVAEYDEYFVPRVMLVKINNQLVRGAHLTRPTFYVMPPVDVFWLENDRIVLAERILDVLKPYLTKLDGFEWLYNVSDNTCFDTDVMDVWESMYDLLTPDFQMSQIEGNMWAMDDFVDISPHATDPKN